MDNKSNASFSIYHAWYIVFILHCKLANTFYSDLLRNLHEIFIVVSTYCLFIDVGKTIQPRFLSVIVIYIYTIESF